MKYIYHAPLADMSEIAPEHLLCASGGNEDFGHKPGSYDLLEPSENQFKFF